MPQEAAGSTPALAGITRDLPLVAPLDAAAHAAVSAHGLAVVILFACSGHGLSRQRVVPAQCGMGTRTEDIEMEFFDQMIAAVEAYPAAHIGLEIINVNVPGDLLNVREVGTFVVRVTNRGPLHMSNATLRIKGLNGTTVKDAPALAQFVTEFVCQPLPTVAAHGGSETSSGTFSFRAPNQALSLRSLIQVTLEGHDFDIEHAMQGHTDPRDTPKALHISAVIGE